MSNQEAVTVRLPLISLHRPEHLGQARRDILLLVRPDSVHHWHLKVCRVNRECKNILKARHRETLVGARV